MHHATQRFTGAASAMARRPRPARPKPLPHPPQPRPPHPGSTAPMVCPECGAPILGPSHVCKPAEHHLSGTVA